MTERERIRCLIRQSWVTATPEEKVRQRLLAYMMLELGYPKAYLAVEKELKQLPHLLQKGLEIPDRRADIIFFAKDIHPDYSLFPLLMVECKAVALTDKVIQQVQGYNHFVQAKYIIIANQGEVRTGRQVSPGQYAFSPDLPYYQKII